MPAQTRCGWGGLPVWGWGTSELSLLLGAPLCVCQAPRLGSICSEILGPGEPSAFPEGSCGSRASYLKGKGDPRPRRLPAQHWGDPAPPSRSPTHWASELRAEPAAVGWVEGRRPAEDAGKGERRGSGADGLRDLRASRRPASGA